jgi:hypothetical protein
VITCLEHATLLFVMVVGIHGALESVLLFYLQRSVQLMPPNFALVILVPDRVSCLIHRTATLSISFRIFGAPVSHGSRAQLGV